MSRNTIPSFLKAAVELIRRKAFLRTSVKQLSQDPLILISLRCFLMIRFYLRNTPTLFSVVLSGKDEGPVLKALNHLVSQKEKFDYIHSLTPQFTAWELQQHTSVDTYFLLESNTAIEMISEISTSVDHDYHAGEPRYVVWHGTTHEEGSGDAYFIDDCEAPPVISCLDNITFRERNYLSASEMVSLLREHPVSLLVCRKWHFKEMSDTLTTASLQELLN